MEKEERREVGEVDRTGSLLQALDHPTEREGISAGFKAGIFFIQLELGIFGTRNGSCRDEERENHLDVQEADPMGSYAGMNKGFGTRQSVGITGIWDGEEFGMHQQGLGCGRFGM